MCLLEVTCDGVMEVGESCLRRADPDWWVQVLFLSCSCAWCAHNKHHSYHHQIQQVLGQVLHSTVANPNTAVSEPCVSLAPS